MKVSLTLSPISNSKNKNCPVSRPVNSSAMSELSRDTVSFSGLTKQMKRQIYIDGQKDIKGIVEKHQGRSLIVGKLPYFIQNKFQNETKMESIKEFYTVFGERANELRSFDEAKVYTIDEIQKRRNNSTKEKFKNLMTKYHLADSWDDIDIEYLGKGGKGAGYKLVGLRNPSGNEDEYIIKVFHVVEGENWQPFKSHGCYAETNTAAYWVNTVGYESNRGKFFWGDLHDGYIINKYVDDDVRLPKYIVDPYKYGLKCTDENKQMKHNVCKDYSFDWGGVRVINRIKNSDKFARSISSKINNTAEKYKELEWYRILSNKHYEKVSKLSGLAMSIKHMPNKLQHIEECLSFNLPKVNQGLSYVLKYLPYEDAKHSFEKVVETKDVITQVVLFNEIPLLAMKHRDGVVRDDLQTLRSDIWPNRIQKYYDIAEKYALPESIAHLASFIHLLPENQFKTYYTRLAKIQNTALHDRMIYKITSSSSANQVFMFNQLAENIKDLTLKKKLILASEILEPAQREKIEKIVGLTLSSVKKIH